ncbi:MAG: hypothetical protein PVI23_12190 [Maricaulaceae bacterium]
MFVTLGDAYLNRGDFSGAREAYEAAHVEALAHVDREPDSIEALRDLAHTHQRLGTVDHAQGDAAKAREHWTSQLAIARDLSHREPSRPDWRRLTIDAHARLAMLGGDDIDTHAGEVERLLTELRAEGALDERDAWLLEMLDDPPDATEELFNIGEASTALFETGEYTAALRASTADLLQINSLYVAGTIDPEIAAGMHGSHAWRALFAREFDVAEASARRGLEIDPSMVWIEMNLAHALMYQGRLDEADAIYRARAGSVLSLEGGDRPWDEVLAEDFTALRGAGLDHSHIDAVLAQSTE